MPNVELSITCAAWRADLSDPEGLVSSAVTAAARLQTIPLHDGAEVSVVLADDTLLRRLNREWRGRDAPTNVLSFPAFDVKEIHASAAAAADTPPLLGDILLAYETVVREATQQSKRLSAHATHLLVHGFLHLLGYDHQSETAAAKMERLEVSVLGELGIGDPYSIPIVGAS